MLAPKGHARVLLLSVCVVVTSCFNSSPTRQRNRWTGARCASTASFQDTQDRVKEVKAAASASQPFSAEELERTLQSFRLVGGEDVDLVALRELLASTAHRSHKKWPLTEEASDALRAIVGTPEDPVFRKVFERVLQDGGWDRASTAAEARAASSKPWVVLVAGVNGIRKTSSIYEPWFKEVLAEALGDTWEGPIEALPGGSDSFFRQLDYIIATVATEEFRELYELNAPVDVYSMVKDGIFARYRTVAETVGGLLVKDAKSKGLNLMVETSGRDIGMFEYIDHFFPGDEYNKLLVHFAINDVSFAETSVDRRMEKEMSDGQLALERLKDGSGSTLGIIAANAGGPYGSSVLRKVQEDSNKVMEQILTGSAGDVGASWYKASITIEGRDDAPWSVRATKPTAKSSSFAFTPRP